MRLYTIIIRPLILLPYLLLICNLNMYAQSSSNDRDCYSEALFSPGILNTIHIDLSDSTRQSMQRDAILKKDYKCSVTINGELYKNASIRTKGASSLNAVVQMGSDRFSFMITLNKYIKGQKYHGLSKISLNNNIWDATQMKDYVVYDMCRYIGLPAPLANYASIFLNGSYLGCYLLVEPVNKDFCKRNYPNEVSNIYKPHHNLSYIGVNTEDYAGIRDFAKVNGNDSSVLRVVEALRSVDMGLDIEKHIDIECLMKYLALQTIVVNFDGLTGKESHNYYLREANGIISLIPWDYNLAWGGYPDEEESETDFDVKKWLEWYDSLSQEQQDSIMAIERERNKTEITKIVNFPIDTPFSIELSKRTFFMDLLSIEQYKKRYYYYLTALAKNYILGGSLKNRISLINKEIDPIVSTEPNAFYTKEQFKKAVETFIIVLEKRAQSVLGQIDGRIPSTWEKQVSNPHTLIDCIDIDINDLGGVLLGRDIE